MQSWLSRAWSQVSCRLNLSSLGLSTGRSLDCLGKLKGVYFLSFSKSCSGLSGPGPESLSGICTVTLNITKCVKVVEKVFSALEVPFYPGVTNCVMNLLEVQG